MVTINKSSGGSHTVEVVAVIIGVMVEVAQYRSGRCREVEVRLVITNLAL